MRSTWFGYCVGSVLLAASAAAATQTVVLANGDRLSGVVVSRDSRGIVLEHPDLGRITLPAERVRSVADATPSTAAPSATSPAGPSVTQPAASPAPEPIAAAVKPSLTPKDSRWKHRIELGGNGSQGDSETLGIIAGYKGTQKTNLDRWKVDATFFYNSSSGDTTRDELTSGVLKDWLVPERIWFPFAEGRYDFNEFGEWRHRASGIGGVGFQVIDEKTTDLILRVGAGGKQQFVSRDEEFHPEASIGLELVWKITQRQKLSAINTFLPELDELGENRNVSKAEWTYKLEDFGNVSLKLGLQNEYKSSTSDNTSHNNAKFVGAFVVDF